MSKDYASWSKDELVRELRKVQGKKKYGIVWEDKPEQVALLCKDKLPILLEDNDKEIVTGQEKPNHVLIEGDNYHALSVLNYTHKGKIDVIYIDPPYNTGSRSWRYNNNYVERDDAFRHSKWISFIEKRLRLAKNLLKSSGIILVTIDDYEVHSLGLLMDEIFGENNRLGTIVIVNKADGRSDDKFIATAHEYMFVYARDEKHAKINELPLSEEEIKRKYRLKDFTSAYELKPLMSQGVDSLRSDRPSLFYQIYYDKDSNKLSTQQRKNAIEIFPTDIRGIERRWSSGRNRVEELIQKDELVCKKQSHGDRYFIFRKVREKIGTKPKSFWFSPKYNAAAHGTKLVDKILNTNRSFDFPKSLYAVIDALIMTSDKKSLVLDFFAGSGTTGHAVLELNNQDGGNRKFILCTNNEDNNGTGLKIAQDICYPRIKNVILNLEKEANSKLVKNLPGNLKYFKTDFVEAEPTDDNKKNMVDKSTEMLCLKEDCFQEIKNGQEFKIFTNGQGKLLGIIYADEGIEPFKKEVKNLKQKISVYVFSLDESAREEEFEDVSRLVDLKPIPSVILNVYKRIFKGLS